MDGEVMVDNPEQEGGECAVVEERGGSHSILHPTFLLLAVAALGGNDLR
jgi:hypothetical protein